MRRDCLTRDEKLTDALPHVTEKSKYKGKTLKKTKADDHWVRSESYSLGDREGKYFQNKYRFQVWSERLGERWIL